MSKTNTNYTGWNEQDIIALLLNNYELRVRPLCHGDFKPTMVSIGGALRQILEVDSKNQVISTRFWMHMRWHDCRLRWNPRLTKIGSLLISADNIWTPDMFLYNSVNTYGGFHIHIREYYSRVRFDGHVHLMVPLKVSSVCKIDVTDFPFDQQKCNLRFGPWSYHGNEVVLKEDGHDAKDELKYYVTNGEWELSRFSTKANLRSYVCCPDPYSDITFRIVLERRPLYYIFNLAFPVVLMVLLVMLNFLLPAESGEKISLGITVLLSLCVFLLVVSNMMPATSETLPLIGICFGVIMVLVSLSCMSTVFVLHLHYRGEAGEPVPLWLSSLAFDFLGKLTCRSRKFVSITNKNRSCIDYCSHHSPIQQRASSQENLKMSSGSSDSSLDVSHMNRSNNKKACIGPCSPEIIIVDVDREWQEVARVVDRFFSLLLFVAFITLIIASVLIINSEDAAREHTSPDER